MLLFPENQKNRLIIQALDRKSLKLQPSQWVNYNTHHLSCNNRITQIGCWPRIAFGSGWTSILHTSTGPVCDIEAGMNLGFNYYIILHPNKY